MVLIIDDDVAWAILMRRPLEQPGALADGMLASCLVVPDEPTLRALLATVAPQSLTVVVLDRHVGAVDSLALLPLLHQSGALRSDAVLIVYSADDEPAPVAEARRSGVDAFLSKGCWVPLGDAVVALVREAWAADTRGVVRPWLEYGPTRLRSYERLARDD